MKHLAWGSVVAVVGLLAACGSSSNASTSSTGGGGGASSSGATSTGSTSGSTSSGFSSSGSSSSGSSSSGSSSSGSSSTGSSTSSSSGAGGGGGAPDPNVDGPYQYAELDDTTHVAATGNDVAIHCAYPTSGPSNGPYPVVLVAHGFQLPPSQYYGYVKRLASFGYVALTVDFQAGLFTPNNVANAKEVLAGIDWAKGAAALAGKADTNNVGATGHSLGGKLALLAATMDARIKASFTLDPVDSSMNCTPQNCPDVSALMPTLKIPTGFIGETTDATGGFMPCAPMADNYDTFYAGANTPSVEVTALGANHMSFLDDVAQCGIICSFCNPATAMNSTVNGMAKAFAVAFYERNLRGDKAYDDYLTGATAQARYVATNEATLKSK